MRVFVRKLVSVPILAASEPGFMILLHDFDARTFSCYNSVLRKYEHNANITKKRRKYQHKKRPFFGALFQHKIKVSAALWKNLSL